MSRLRSPSRATISEYFDSIGLRLESVPGARREYRLSRTDGRGTPIHAPTLAILWNLWEMEADGLLRDAENARRVRAKIESSPEEKEKLLAWLDGDDVVLPEIQLLVDPLGDRVMPRGWRKAVEVCMSVAPDNDFSLVPSFGAIARAALKDPESDDVTLWLNTRLYRKSAEHGSSGHHARRQGSARPSGTFGDTNG
jgi:hypothetical protein